MYGEISQTSQYSTTRRSVVLGSSQALHVEVRKYSKEMLIGLGYVNRHLEDPSGRSVLDRNCSATKVKFSGLPDLLTRNSSYVCHTQTELDSSARANVTVIVSYRQTLNSGEGPWGKSTGEEHWEGH